jgi:hypothetical protein
MTKQSPEVEDSMRAMAELWRLAQAHALARMVREGQGALDDKGKIEPSLTDINAVEKDHPDLVRRAARGNPRLSGEG